MLYTKSMYIFQKLGFVMFVIELAISIATVKASNQDASSMNSLEKKITLSQLIRRMPSVSIAKGIIS